MGKKKVKDRGARAESSDETPVTSCFHIRKSIEQNLLKKANLGENRSFCQECEADKPKETEDLEDQTDRENPVWMCLKCGHRGCGRTEKQHALKHFETPRSEPHCLVLNLDAWSIWCYICDDEVQFSSTGKLAQLITNIRKLVLKDPDETTSRKSKKGDLQKSPSEQKLDGEKVTENQKSSCKKEDHLKPQGSTGSSGVVTVRGLSNLGNTCFFNAVIQNLSQTHYLRELLKKISDKNSCITFAPALPSELETKKGVVTPKELFTQVCKKAPRFRGFQQQDSQELLRYLLDGMRAEDVKRVHSGITEALKSSGKNVEAEQMKKVIKEYEKSGASKNFVDQVFGGAMSSTVMCKECRTVSLVTETFLDLSLPVADEGYRKKQQTKSVQFCNKISDYGDGDSMPTLTNGDEHMPTEAGSKYQQKKAKKQAKKQAKNQRRQQKLGSKLTLEALTNQNVDGVTESSDNSIQIESVPGNADSETGEPLKHLNADQLLPISPNDVEDDDEERSPSVNNRFTALSEELTIESVLEEAEKQDDVTEEEGAHQHCPEDEMLVEKLNSISLETPPESEVVNGEEASNDFTEYRVVNGDPELAFKALAARSVPGKQECSVESCLHQFTEVEHLSEINRLMCATCTKRQAGAKASYECKKPVYRDALKQMLISDPPAVLTLHLKRFQQVSYSVCKVNRHVQFPQILDIAPFCSVNCKGIKDGTTQVLYRLYGIVEHSGTMRSGHYVAYVKSKPPTHSIVEHGTSFNSDNPEAGGGCWFHVSDSSVHPVTEAKVQSCQAYLLFYEKIT
ncbi:hypothetical protein DNTS_027299 [Danionella cerebrum]|uniref:Ubiquitin carboxyl-terminal hydrolase n=1 Tax=Danionella cerebrum TaxID=2873325 RepID=A0A553QWC1_9TELE|nr:hypothetical protein DNTS_027299 [Danionella translucida]